MLVLINSVGVMKSNCCFKKNDYIQCFTNITFFHILSFNCKLYCFPLGYFVGKKTQSNL